MIRYFRRLKDPETSPPASPCKVPQSGCVTVRVSVRGEAAYRSLWAGDLPPTNSKPAPSLACRARRKSLHCSRPPNPAALCAETRGRMPVAATPPKRGVLALMKKAVQRPEGLAQQPMALAAAETVVGQG